MYHAICRGNNRERVFADDEDFATYLDLCRRYKERDGFRLYHWVLMPNHAHLLLEPVESPLSRTMQGLGGNMEQRQLAYRDYVCSDRPKEEEEFRARMAKGCIGRDEFAEAICRQAIQQRRPRRGRPKSSCKLLKER